MKAAVKALLYRHGIASFLHKWLNRHSLTVVMLHRVLPEALVKEQGALREWTLADDTFSDFLEFLKKHYNPISYNDLQEANAIIKALPDRSLLLTFDDGWQDNFQFALPHLTRHSFPAHVFVASDKIGSQKAFWQEQIYSACERSPEAIEKILNLIKCDLKLNSIAKLVDYLSQRDMVMKEFAELFSLIEAYLPENRQMLSEHEILTMSDKGITFGSHGASHSPLSRLSNEQQKEELDRSKRKLTNILNTDIDNISFPHGDYSSELLKRCTEAGFELLFTSNAHIKVSDGNLIPRISVSENSIARAGKFSAVSAAYYLFFRNRV